MVNKIFHKKQCFKPRLASQTLTKECLILQELLCSTLPQAKYNKEMTDNYI